MFLEFLHLLPFLYFIYIIIMLLVFGLLSEMLRISSMKIIYPICIFSLFMLLSLIADDLEISVSFLGQKDNIFLIVFLC